jgi:hypothetical protein
MPIVSPLTPRERILVFAPEGCGKTRAAFSIARRIRPHHIAIIDMDCGAEYFPPQPNVEIYKPESHAEILTVLNKIRPSHTPDDWLVVDNMAEGNLAAQRAVVDDVAEFRMATTNDYGRTNSAMTLRWGDINSKLVRWPGHVLCLSPAEDTWETEKDERYRKLGKKPGGHKSIRFSARSLLYFARAGDRFLMSTVKDIPGRSEALNCILKDFAEDYLIKVAGWREAEVAK